MFAKSLTQIFQMLEHFKVTNQLISALVSLIKTFIAQSCDL